MFLANKYEARLLENEKQLENPLVLEARDMDLNGELTIYLNYILTGLYNLIGTAKHKYSVRNSLAFNCAG